MRREQPPELPGNRELLESLLNVEGSLGSTYNRFHNYSSRNLGYLALQGCPLEPIATYKRWGELGRQVQRGQKAYSILRPIQVKAKDQDPDDEPTFIRRFKTVRAIFAVSQTEGDELPPYEPPEWSRERALGRLGITLGQYELMDGNVQGYSYGRTVTVNPVAVWPFKTLLHEMSHVEAGHTTDERDEPEEEHRGLAEFEAEGSAHLAMMQLDAADQFNASESRGYIQTWLRSEAPPEQSMARVLTVSSKIVAAGYESKEEA